MRPRSCSAPIAWALLALFLVACGGEAPRPVEEPVAPALPPPHKQAKYATVALQPDLEALSDGEREALPHLIAALDAIDDAFWRQVFGQKAGLLSSMRDPDARRFAEINYGPWDRLDEDRPFLPVRPKPATSRFYPLDLQPGELDAAASSSADGGARLRDPYTIVQRDDNQALRSTPFHEFFAESVRESSEHLERAAMVVDDPALARYLNLRAQALLDDSYAASHEAWLRIDGALGVAIGPVDPGEDHLYRTKLAYAGGVWARLPEWNDRVEAYRSRLPELAGKLWIRGAVANRSEVEFEVADLIHVVGSWNAGPKRLAIELPTDANLRERHGTRRLLWHNVARAKYESNLVPLAESLIVEEQRDRVTLDAFFVNDLLLEMVRAETGSEEGQALRRLYGDAAWVVGVVRANAIAASVVGKLAKEGASGSSVEEHYTTMVAGAFRSLRLGSSSAQGPAALILLNKLRRDDAIVHEDGSPEYRVDVAAVQRSVRDLAERLAGAADPANVEGLGAWLGELSQPDPALVADLDRLAVARVPIDVAFE